MYFPAAFELPRAIELARLVQQPYDLLDSFRKGTHWTLQGNYSLVSDLACESFAARSSRESASLLDAELMELAKSANKGASILPIGFVAEDERNIYVVFRGTMTIAEWFRNLNVRLADYIYPGHGKVHDGLIKTYKVIRKTVLQILTELDPGKKLFLAGHSVGAGLVCLASLDIMRATRFKAPRVYTYASPRVGDGRLAHAYNTALVNRSFRIVNTSDAVVSLPLPGPILGVFGGYFTHVDTPVDFTIQNDDMEKNHVIERYLSALIAARRERGIVSKVLRWRPAHL